MIQIERTKLTSRGECRGFVLEIAFSADVTDVQFEAFADQFYTALEPLRLVNFAARVAARTIELDTSDVLGDDPTSFIRDVRTALHAAGCAAERTARE